MNGIIVLNKPAGRTSFEAVRAVSRFFSKEKAGHSGTLDPMATGVLPVFLGRATKLIQYLPDTDKEYIADIAFGIKTDTGDREGKPVSSSDTRPNEKDWYASVQAHFGEQTQIPPMYSAIKKNGVPLYDMARQGKTIDREPRTIIVSDIETLDFASDKARIRVRCSAGTYIRTLAEDLASQCGCFAYLKGLERIYACGFSIKDAVTLEELEVAEDKEKFLIEPSALFTDYPSVELDENLARLFLNGFVFPVSRLGKEYETGLLINVYKENKYIGLGTITDTAELKKLWQAEEA
ncbi:MAG: tRNA pseudouridine(55) synthase TruB [Oscillospiraceae bacterium]|nr:tRNA pseudouridine(55) synthase TruB [Oscillospiraceae bacterium]